MDFLPLLFGMKWLLQYLCFVPALAVRSPLVLQDSSQYQQNLTHAVVKVPVQLGVMSRCPDALLCENIFDQVLDKVAGKIELSLIYVAKIDPSEPDFGVRCMHGAEECAGNVQQLCVAKYESSSSWWEFVQCQNFEGRDKIGNPDITLKCGRVAGIDWATSKAKECAGLDGNGQGAEGIRLLKESVVLSQTLGVEKSCTVLISGRKVCIHDGTWKECEGGHAVNDFIKRIDDEYERLNYA